MEPWQEEALYRRAVERKPAPRCEVCGERITTELCLELSRFGLTGYACEDCLDKAKTWTEVIYG